MTPSQSVELEAAVERAVMVCPPCEGEGSYADGVDEAACSTECHRCGGNGWIVDVSALSASNARDLAAEEALRVRAEEMEAAADTHKTSSRARAFVQGRAAGLRDAITTLASMKEKDRG